MRKDGMEVQDPGSREDEREREAENCHRAAGLRHAVPIEARETVSE